MLSYGTPIQFWAGEYSRYYFLFEEVVECYSDNLAQFANLEIGLEALLAVNDVDGMIVLQLNQIFQNVSSHISVLLFSTLPHDLVKSLDSLLQAEHLGDNCLTLGTSYEEWITLVYNVWFHILFGAPKPVSFYRFFCDFLALWPETLGFLLVWSLFLFENLGFYFFRGWTNLKRQVLTIWIDRKLHLP